MCDDCVVRVFHIFALCLLLWLAAFACRFAKASWSEHAAWSALLTDFLTQRGFMTLRRALVLVDARRGPGIEDWR